MKEDIMKNEDLPLPIGDGIHDDTEAIRAWIKAGKAPPFESNKTYIISESINLSCEYCCNAPQDP
jgi:hypothetical protein